MTMTELVNNMCLYCVFLNVKRDRIIVWFCLSGRIIYMEMCRMLALPILNVLHVTNRHFFKVFCQGDRDVEGGNYIKGKSCLIEDDD